MCDWTTPAMESLLSLSFDYLSSFDSGKIRKGLRQLEGLLAQICLSRPAPSTAAEKRRSKIGPGSKEQIPKELSSLKDDPAFREFFKLQEGFEWNGSFTREKPHTRRKERASKKKLTSVISSCHQTNRMPRTTPWKRKQRSKRPPDRLHPRPPPRDPDPPPSFPLPLRPRNLHESPPRSPRPLQLSRNPVLHPPNPRHRPARTTTQYPHIRDPRRTTDRHLAIQIQGNKPRGQDEGSRIPILLSNARGASCL